MKLALATAALQILFFASNPSDSLAFSISNLNVKKVSFTKLHAEVDDIVKAYAKNKGGSGIKLPDTVPETPPPTPVTVPTPPIAETVAAPPLPEVTSTPPIEAVSTPTSGEALPLGEFLKQMKSNELASKAPEISLPKDDSVVSLKEMMKGALTKPDYTPPTAPEGKVLPLSDYLKQVSSKDYAPPESNFDPLLNAQEKLAILKQNFQGIPQGLKSSVSDVPDVSGLVPKDPATTKIITNSADFFKPASDSLAKMSQNVGSAAGAAAANGSAAVTSDTFNQLIEKLHLQEYGSWYVTAFALIYASTQKNAGKQEARKEYEAELAAAKEQALEAAALATNAANLATKSKELASQAQVETSPTRDVLDDSRRKELEFENDMMKQEINKLISQTTQLQSQISAVTKTSSVEQPKTAEKPPRVVEVMPRDPEEDSRILEVLKEIDEENEKKFGAAKKAEAATSASMAADVDRKEAAAEAEAKLQAAIEALAAAEAEEKAAKAALAAAEEQEKLAAEARAAVEVAEAAAAAEAAEKAKAVEAKKKKKKKKAPKKAPAKKKVEAAVPSEEPVTSGDPHPWSKLTKSGLSRKTVKELSEFLSERGVTTTNESGKARAKKELLEEVTLLL